MNISKNSGYSTSFKGVYGIKSQNSTSLQQVAKKLKTEIPKEAQSNKVPFQLIFLTPESLKKLYKGAKDSILCVLTREDAVDYINKVKPITDKIKKAQETRDIKQLKKLNKQVDDYFTKTVIPKMNNKIIEAEKVQSGETRFNTITGEVLK